MQLKETLLFIVAVLLASSVVLTPAAGQRATRQDARAIDIVGVSQTISYQGVSFTCDRSLAQAVTPQTIPAATEGKPSDEI